MIPHVIILIYSKGPDFNISRAGMMFNLMTLHKKSILESAGPANARERAATLLTTKTRIA